MPATTPERAARWPGMDRQAMDHLEAGGWVLGRDWVYRHPENRKPTETEIDAAIYLIEEWDMGGLRYKEQDGSAVEKEWTKEEVEGAAQGLAEVAEALRNSGFVNVEELAVKVDNARTAVLYLSDIVD